MMILLVLVGVATCAVIGFVCNIADRQQKNMQAIKAMPVRAGSGTMAMPSWAEAIESVKEFIEKYPHAKDAYFPEVEFTEPGFALIAQLHDVQRLRLTGASFDNKWLHYLTGLQNLEELGIEKTSVTSEGVKQLSSMKQLRVLNLKETAVDDQAMKYLPPGLTRLDLSQTSVTDAGMSDLRKCTTLLDVNLMEDDISDRGIEIIAYPPDYRILALQATKITDKCMPAIGKLSDLVFLDISRTAVTDKGLSYLHGLKKMQKVVLHSDPGVTEHGIEQLKAAWPHTKFITVRKSRIRDD
ncbi:MAG TPA: hypothetical protein V6C81_16370 [Planktothrix sp.]|jgi:hypothetical protein